jgi:hypothetical protein
MVVKERKVGVVRVNLGGIRWVGKGGKGGKESKRW